VKEPTTWMKKEKLWWEKEPELAACHPDDSEDTSGLRLLETRSFQKVQPMDGATVCLMSAIDSGNFIALDSDADSHDE
jgi:hypothetical protein